MAKFEDKSLQSKGTVNLYVYNFIKILAKLHIHDHFLPIFLIKVINIIGKNNIVQEIKDKHILKTVRPIASRQKLYCSMCI